MPCDASSIVREARGDGEKHTIAPLAEVTGFDREMWRLDSYLTENEGNIHISGDGVDRDGCCILISSPCWSPRSGMNAVTFEAFSVYLLSSATPHPSESLPITITLPLTSTSLTTQDTQPVSFVSSLQPLFLLYSLATL